MTVCKDCPLRLYNTKGYNLQGVGNPWYGNCIVVPNVDYKAYKGKSMSFSTQVEIIEDILSLSTGEMDCKVYIVPLIRCNEQISCEVDDATIKRCLTLFAQDVKKYDFKRILLLGTAAKRFLDVDLSISELIDKYYVSHNNRRYEVNYSPLVKYNDKIDYFELFSTKLKQWYYDYK